MASHQYIWAFQALVASFSFILACNFRTKPTGGERERERGERVSLKHTNTRTHKHEHIRTQTLTRRTHWTQKHNPKIYTQEKGASLKLLVIHHIPFSSASLRGKKSEREILSSYICHFVVDKVIFNPTNSTTFFTPRNSRIFSLTLGIKLPFSAFDRYLQLPRYPIKSLTLSLSLPPFPFSKSQILCLFKFFRVMKLGFFFFYWQFVLRNVFVLVLEF